jgi:hypothetical protein
MSVRDKKPSAIRQRAQLLRDDPGAVLSERRKRRIQETGPDVLSTTLNQDWASELNIDSQSTPTSHYFLTGAAPVVVTGPAIVIQPIGGELERGDD